MIVAKKDYNLPKHPEVTEVSNLEVIKLCTSLTSRELVSCRFAWKHYYWFLTDEGIEYLREYLHLPEDSVPNTLKKSTRPTAPPGRPQQDDRPPRRERFSRSGDHDDYRGGGGGGGRPRGFGRGAPPRQSLPPTAPPPPPSEEGQQPPLSQDRGYLRGLASGGGTTVLSAKDAE